MKWIVVYAGEKLRAIVVISFCLALTVNAAVGKSTPRTAGMKISRTSIILKTGKSRDGKAVLYKLAQKFRSCKEYVFDSTLITFRRSGKKIKQVGRLYFKAPNLIRVEVKSGHKRGSIVVRQPDGSVKGKPGGFLKGLTVTLSPNSRLLRTPNGFNVLKTDVASLLKQAREELKPGQKCLASIETCDYPGYGRVKMIEILDKDKKVAQRVAIDPRTSAPLEWLIFDGSRLVSRTVFSQIKLNPHLSNDLFNLESAEALANAKLVPPQLATIAGHLYEESKPIRLTGDLVRDSKRAMSDLSSEAANLSTANIAKTSIGSDTISKSKKQAGSKLAWSDLGRQKLLLHATAMERNLDSIRIVCLAFNQNAGKLSPDLSRLMRDWSMNVSKVEKITDYLVEAVDADNPDPARVKQGANDTRATTRKLQDLADQLFKRLQSE